MRVRIILRLGKDDAAEEQLFSDVFIARQFRWFPLLISLAAHAVMVALIPVVVDMLADFGYVDNNVVTYKVEPLRLQLPDRIFFPASRPHPKEESAPEKPAPAPAAAAQARPAPGAAAQLRASLPQLQLPATRHISDQAPVILQPDPVPPPKMAIPALPPIAFWSKATPPPAPRKTVTPGRVTQPSVSPNLDAPPVLGAPNAQPLASDIAASLVSPQVTAPKLPLPNSSTNPVRIRGKGSPDVASFDVAQSDPVNLIYLMAENTSARQVEIPRGLQNTPRSTSDSAVTTMPGRAPDAAGRQASILSAAQNRPGAEALDSARAANVASNSSAAPSTAAATGGAGGAALPTTRTAAADSATPANHPAAPPSSASPGSTPAKALATEANAAHAAAPAGSRPPDPPNDNPGVIRVNHPSNGNFDVVILQSAAVDDLPDVGGVLSGNPVYTVYLSVGDAREWLLEYCIPANPNSRASSFQVNIDDPGVVTAPYPLSTLIPRNITELPHRQHIVLHGLLSTAGVLHEVKAARDSELVREVLPLLSQWEFRPALRDKVPVEVEVLLIIPPRI